MYKSNNEYNKIYMWETIKSLMKEVKDHNKWRNTPCL